jgi:hypothetical protein
VSPVPPDAFSFPKDEHAAVIMKAVILVLLLVATSLALGDTLERGKSL